MNRFTYNLILIGILTLQFGCGSSNSGSDSTDNGDDTAVDNSSSDADTNTNTDNNQDNTASTSRTVRFVGLAGVVEGKTGSSASPVVVANVRFDEYEKAFEIPESASTPYSELLGTCEVSNDSSNSSGTSIPQPDPVDNAKTNNIDAGTGIRITSAGEEYLDLARISLGNDSVIYGSIEDSPPMAPDLELTIPGDGLFPAFANVPITTVSPVNLELPSNDTVRFDTKFKWQASGDPSVIVLLSASAFNTTVECVTQDSGSFEFPQETQNELGTGFFGNTLRTTRLTYDIKFKDGAALIVYSMSETD